MKGMKNMNMKNMTMMTISPERINKNERLIIASFLFTVAVLAFLDIYNDYFEGVSLWHISIELTVALLSLAGVFFLLKDHFRLHRTLLEQQEFSKDLQVEAQKWKRVSKTYLQGLSAEIDDQLGHWNLTEAEKEVAFLLLKGLSDKNIANVRNTSVKTARTQVNAIYTKSGLSSRSELSAFFLEDLLLPKQKVI